MVCRHCSKLIIEVGNVVKRRRSQGMYFGAGSRKIIKSGSSLLSARWFLRVLLVFSPYHSLQNRQSRQKKTSIFFQKCFVYIRPAVMKITFKSWFVFCCRSSIFCVSSLPSSKNTSRQNGDGVTERDGRSDSIHYYVMRVGVETVATKPGNGMLLHFLG